MIVAFYKHQDRLFDRLVRFVTGSVYSHCELIVNGVSYSASMRDGGVRQKVIDYKPERWDFVEVDGEAMTAVRWFHEHEEDHYDYLGLLGFLTPWRTESQSRWFCSEAVAAALGIPEPWKFSPGKLYRRLLWSKSL
jgi:hypothetical protein